MTFYTHYDLNSPPHTVALCDGCGQPGAGAPTFDIAVELARARGWTELPAEKRLLCAACRADEDK